MHFFKSVRQTWEILGGCQYAVINLSILSAHTTDELYATKKDIRTFNDHPLFETANKIQLYFDEASKIVIILVTAYQLSIAAVINRNLIGT